MSLTFPEAEGQGQTVANQVSRETAGLRKLLSQNQSAWERPGPDERAGGWLSGDTEAEIHEDSETDSKTARGDTHTHTHAHAHTHFLISLPNLLKRGGCTKLRQMLQTSTWLPLPTPQNVSGRGQRAQ